MSNLKTSEDEFMKNLSANEKRKLLRHIETSQLGIHKKASSSPHLAKNYNVGPKPFNNSAGIRSSASQPSKLNKEPQVSSRKPTAAPIKRVQAPNGKSSSVPDVVIPELNKKFVNMFNDRDSSSSTPKLKAVPKVPVPSNNTGNNKPPFIVKNTAFNKPAQTPSSNYAKVSPVPSSRPTSSPNVTPAWKKAVIEKKLSDDALNNVNRKPTPYAPPKIANSHQFSEKKPAPRPVSTNQVKQPHLEVKKRPEVAELKPQSKEVSKAPKPVIPPKTESRKPPVNQPTNVQPVASNKPTSNVLQQRAEPLNSDKSSTKSTPPTAVVSPIQDKSKPVSKEVNNSAEAARLRSVSTPVPPPSNAVSYSSAADHVNLPDLSLAERNSVMAKEGKKKRSLSEASKVAAQMKDAANKNRKLGHNFLPYELKNWVNWCDACGSVILSLFGKCVSCSKCKMVCHGKCALSVSLTCEADQQVRSLTLTDSALKLCQTIVQETTDESTLKEYNTIQRVITFEEVQQKIEEFNRTVKGSQQMTLQENGETFRGFIRVTMNLTRPVSVMDHSSKTVRKPSHVQRKASFYIDKGAMKALHLTSDTTAEQVVQALLHKYNITDNPMKFALFEKQVREEGHVILRKMLPRERPLFLRLLWGNGNSDKRGFTLQENESRDIHWESFSIAELQMFIKILDKEENDYILDIKRKYKNKVTDLKNAMQHQAKLSAH